MTIGTEITRIKTNIENAYTALGEKGATIPEVQNSDSLATTISSLPSGSSTEDEVIPDGYFKVVFVDYDGTILSEQLVASGGDAIPPTVPIHDNLTFTQWNRDTTNIDEHQIIGASYSIHEGTAIYVVDISDEQLVQKFYFTYKNVNSEATSEAYIDWGDGTIDTLNTQLVSDVGWNSFEVCHTYLTPGKYYIKSYYWQTLEKSTFLQGGGMLTKSLPMSSSALKLVFDYRRNDSCTIVPEIFEELKELYLSPEASYNIKDPFYAPNLKHIVLSDKSLYCLDNSTSTQGAVFFEESIYREGNILSSNNKIKHVTLPRNGWEGTNEIKHLPFLETVSYANINYYCIGISYCPSITKLYNMTYKSNGYKSQNLKLSYLPNLRKLYNPIINGICEYSNLNSLKKVILDYPVGITNCYSLSELTARFNDVTDKAIFRLSNCYSLEKIDIDWNEVRLDVNYSNLPSPGSPFLSGVLDLSSNTTSSIGDVVTPAYTSNTSSALWYKGSYNKIILPFNLQTLNINFSNMIYLEEVVFPDTLEVINMYSLFTSCYNLKSVKLPKDIIATATSCYGIYSNCFALKNAIIPSGTVAKSSLISNCPSLERIWISSGSDLSYYTHSNYTLCGTSQASVMENVTVYTDANSKPDAWGEYWNYIGDSKYMNVVWGATYEEYDAA